MLQNPNFLGLCPGPRWWRAYSTPLDPVVDGKRAHCPLSRTPPPLSALQVSFLWVSVSNPLQS